MLFFSSGVPATGSYEYDIGEAWRGHKILSEAFVGAYSMGLGSDCKDFYVSI